MEVKVLGCYGRFAPIGGATSGYLITTNSGKNIIIDLGSGCLSNLQKYIAVQDIDMIILSHLHFDHVSDIGVLKYAMGFLKVKGIQLYMPNTPKDMFNILGGGFEVNVITDKLLIEQFGLSIQFLSNHHPVETYSVWIIEDGKSLVYTSDCMTSDDILKSTACADYVIGDACVLHSDWSDKSPHVSVRMLSESVPDNCTLYLAHLTSGIENNILAEAKEYHLNAELVCDFKII